MQEANPPCPIESPMPPENTPHSLLELAPIVAGSIVSKPIADANGTRISSVLDGRRTDHERAPRSLRRHRPRPRRQAQIQHRRSVASHLAAHDWLVMPPDQPHDLVAEEPCRFLLTLAKGAP
jgi:hypothetical protein